MTMDGAAVEVRPELFATEVAGILGSTHRLAALFAMPQARCVRLVAVLAGQGRLMVIAATLAEGTTSYPSVTALVPGADWYEREIHDLYGIEAIGHPDLDPLVLPLSPGSIRPRPGSGDQVDRLVPDSAPLPALVSGEGMFTISYGPVRSGVFEAIEYVIETPGEDFPRIQTRPHYKHRGVEFGFVGRSVEDGVLLAERVEGVATIAHATAYCEAIERISGAEPPPAGQFVRVLHAELERIANHLDSTIRHTEAAGQAVAFARLTLHKERLMRLRAKLCGNRFGRCVVVPGGVCGAPLIEGVEILASVDHLERDIRADLKLLMATPSFLDRLRDTGILPPSILAVRGALGPLARGSGIEEDVRRSRPYGGYRNLGFSSASGVEGDALARQLVRNDEIWGSFHLIRQALDELDHLAGVAWSAPMRTVATGTLSGEAFGWAEAPQGEVLYLVRVEDGVLTRVKQRSASFHNLALFTAAFPKDITTDFAFIEASFGLSIAGAAG
ncbi:MAG TPA: NADH-quinone oxidoreductase subunit C [Acidimicrobiales bacterium]|nr:NADH-quinone oxidoreductase subunit C [Acidimicrobiales bacterium]